MIELLYWASVAAVIVATFAFVGLDWWDSGDKG